ncbi:MAG: PqqD family peptide modification chaperone [Candidatus Aminicenantes bacterium]|nr:PqqD family peptide modification chaperone [Candidatus Aminicenantes bacterium]
MSGVKRYQVNSVVSCGEEKDGAVLFNPDTNDTAVINISGRLLWHFLETPHSIKEMSLYLTEKFDDVSLEQATEDVTQFVQNLLSDFLSS